MEKFNIVQISWAIAVTSFPVCALLICIIFKEEIKNLINKYTKTTPKKWNNRKIEEKDENLKNETSVQTKENIAEYEATEDNNYLSVDVCTNKSSGLYFIVLEETDDEVSKMINPNGNTKDLEIKLFNEVISEKIIDLQNRGSLTKEQILSYHEYIKRDSDNFFDNFSNSSGSSDEPAYISSYRNMLKNSNTWPSRMLNIIRKRKHITQVELKRHMELFYFTCENNGSFNASLRLLLVDDYITIEGFGDNKMIKIKPKYIEEKEICSTTSHSSGRD